MKQEQNCQPWKRQHAHLGWLDRFKAAVSYNDETGEFVWLTRPARRCRLGERAGTISNGRRYITVSGYKLACSRIAWWFKTGALPVGDVDHKDGDKLNDSIINLRDVTRRVNCENLRRAKNHNKLGILGVRRMKSGFEARITVRGVELTLGSFESAARAHEAYLIAKRRFHEGCTL